MFSSMTVPSPREEDTPSLPRRTWYMVLRIPSRIPSSRHKARHLGIGEGSIGWLAASEQRAEVGDIRWPVQAGASVAVGGSEQVAAVLEAS
jgi:hypothetical protein